MIEYLRRKLFNKPEEDNSHDSKLAKSIRFTLKIGKLEIGYLTIENAMWTFRYSTDFKEQEKYSRLVGFSNLNKVYKSEVLWPFFKIRIPGLKQPLIQEILESENIDKNDEASLLKRFGRNNISNPYVLESA